MCEPEETNTSATRPPLRSDLPSHAAPLFKAPAKWEQNKLTHSPGHVTLSTQAVEFIPGPMSLLGKHVIIPLAQIARVRRGDNFLWRGVVKLDLGSEVDGRSRYIFFLGGKREEFLARCLELGVTVA